MNKHVWQGYGQADVAVGAATKLAIPDGGFAYECSVHNTGTARMYAVLDTEVGNYDESTAIPLEAGEKYTWELTGCDIRDGVSIHSITTSSAGTTANIAFN